MAAFGSSAHHIPKTKSDFWRDKFAKNQERDQRLLVAAHEAGWETLVVWECELKDTALVADRLYRYLGPPRAKALPRHLLGR